MLNGVEASVGVGVVVDSVVCVVDGGVGWAGPTSGAREEASVGWAGVSVDVEVEEEASGVVVCACGG